MKQADFHGWPDWPPLNNLDAERASRLLWDEVDLLHVPAWKAVCVFDSLVAHLPQSTLPAEQIFVSQAKWIRVQQPQALSTIFRQSPQAFHWTRVAAELLGALRTGRAPLGTAASYCKAVADGDIQAAWECHLARFSLIVLGAAIVGGSDLYFDCPLKVELPSGIPGTDIAILGKGVIEIGSLIGGQPRAVNHSKGVELRDPLLTRVPSAHYNESELVLNPFAFCFPGLEVASPAIDAGLEFQKKHKPLIEDTLQVLSRYVPDTLSKFRQLIQLAALKPPDAGGYDDFSEPEIAGSCLLSAVDNPLEMADHLIHEFQHNRMSLVEESGSLFTGTTATEPRFYSPWRDKPRGLYGVFHGVYVFVAVTRYWMQVYQDCSPTDRPYVTDRLLRLPVQLRLANSMLARYATLTRLGSVIFAQLQEATQDVTHQVSLLRLPGDADAWVVEGDGGYIRKTSSVDERPVSVMESLREHAQLYDRFGQCRELIEQVARPAA